MKKLVLLSIVTILASTLCFAQSKEGITKKEKRAKKKAVTEKMVKELLESKDFIFEARHVIPMSGASINLTSEYDITIKNDSAFAYLPFFGVAYRVEYGSFEGGIKFEEPTKDYNLIMKKNIYAIEFTVDTDKDLFNCYLDISSSGYGTLKISSNNRQQISYHGILKGLSL